MAKIKKGVRLYVVNPQGDIIDSIDIGENDLNKPFARGYIMNEIVDMLEHYNLVESSQED